jgi:hypothetical protein
MMPDRRNFYAQTRYVRPLVEEIIKAFLALSHKINIDSILQIPKKLINHVWYVAVINNTLSLLAMITITMITTMIMMTIIIMITLRSTTLTNIPV